MPFRHAKRMKLTSFDIFNLHHYFLKKNLKSWLFRLLIIIFNEIIQGTETKEIFLGFHSQIAYHV
jgi:hypothetical protein